MGRNSGLYFTCIVRFKVHARHGTTSHVGADLIGLGVYRVNGADDCKLAMMADLRSVYDRGRRVVVVSFDVRSSPNPSPAINTDTFAVGGLR